MEITKEALKLFIQSLPVGCTFAILGFGTQSQFIQTGLVNSWQRKTDDSIIWNYNDQNLPIILSEIGKLKADLGGTDILSPLV